MLEDQIKTLLPKKGDVTIAKCPNRVELVCSAGEPLFFNTRGGPYFPTLRMLPKCPRLLPKMVVDAGAIRHIMSGSNIFCAGFTSEGGRMDTEIEAKQPVAIYGTGKRHAVAIGITEKSTKEIREKNKGNAVLNMHYLSDGLWPLTTLR
jgi:PUA domain protein